MFVTFKDVEDNELVVNIDHVCSMFAQDIAAHRAEEPVMEYVIEYGNESYHTKIDKNTYERIKGIVSGSAPDSENEKAASPTPGFSRQRTYKCLSDADLGDIVWDVTHGNIDTFESATVYTKFLQCLAELVCQFCGGIPGAVNQWEDREYEWSVNIHPSGNVPPDGGVYRDYDTAINWKRDG